MLQECKVNATFDADKCSPDSSSVEPLHWAHGGLDVQRPHILPVLLQQRDQEVHGEMDILDKIVFSHTHVANSNRQAKHLGTVIVDQLLYKTTVWLNDKRQLSG